MSSESAFSTGGRILDDRRMSLTPEMVEILTLGRDWEQAADYEEQRIAQQQEMNEFFNNMYLGDNGASPGAGPSNV